MNYVAVQLSSFKKKKKGFSVEGFMGSGAMQSIAHGGPRGSLVSLELYVHLVTWMWSRMGECWNLCGSQRDAQLNRIRLIPCQALLTALHS